MQYLYLICAIFLEYLCNICTIFVQRPVHPRCIILCNICAIFVQYIEIFLQYTCNICGQTLSGSPLGDNLSEARASASLMKTTAIWLFASIALTAMYLLFDIYSTISFCFWVKSLRESYAPSFMHPEIIRIHCQAYYPWSTLSTSPFVACATLCNLHINCISYNCLHLVVFVFIYMTCNTCFPLLPIIALHQRVCGIHCIDCQDSNRQSFNTVKHKGCLKKLCFLSKKVSRLLEVPEMFPKNEKLSWFN